MRKFDFIIGNPPYQDDRRGTSNTAQPVYHTYMDTVNEIATASMLVTPARFLFDAGLTPKEWNRKMLDDPHLKVEEYVSTSSQYFPDTDIKGGVAITYHDNRKDLGPIGVFTSYPQLNSILDRVRPHLDQDGSLADTAFVASKFNLETLQKDYPETKSRERRMSTNVLSMPFFHDNKNASDEIGIFGLLKGKRVLRYINPEYVDCTDPAMYQYKVVVATANGNGEFGEVLTNPQVLHAGEGFTHTFLGMGGYTTLDEAQNLLKYIKTKTARALLGTIKITQHINAAKWRYVPLQDFTTDSDIDWTQSIANIDQQLYRKYNLSDEEIDFIETHVKEMA